VQEATPKLVEQQLDAVLSDIFPDAIKIGMVADVEIIETIAQKLRECGVGEYGGNADGRHNAGAGAGSAGSARSADRSATGGDEPGTAKPKVKNIVVDPVMVSSSGSSLISDEAKSTIQDKLFPLADVITPNIPEAQTLCERSVETEKDMVECGTLLAKKFNTAVLVKGGHSVHDATDYLCYSDRYVKFSGERINNHNTHGTGCTLSSAIACGLAEGKTLEDSIRDAKAYLTGALKSMLDLGQGIGPVDHTWGL
jgi:hydroxymethylpyrimidine/phosphomethylpyrimidine kinase